MQQCYAGKQVLDLCEHLDMVVGASGHGGARLSRGFQICASEHLDAAKKRHAVGRGLIWFTAAVGGGNVAVSG